MPGNFFVTCNVELKLAKVVPIAVIENEQWTLSCGRVIYHNIIQWLSRMAFVDSNMNHSSFHPTRNHQPMRSADSKTVS